MCTVNTQPALLRDSVQYHIFVVGETPHVTYPQTDPANQLTKGTTCSLIYVTQGRGLIGNDGAQYEKQFMHVETKHPIIFIENLRKTKQGKI